MSLNELLNRKITLWEMWRATIIALPFGWLGAEIGIFPNGNVVTVAVAIFLVTAMATLLEMIWPGPKK